MTVTLRRTKARSIFLLFFFVTLIEDWVTEGNNGTLYFLCFDWQLILEWLFFIGSFAQRQDKVEEGGEDLPSNDDHRSHRSRLRHLSRASHVPGFCQVNNVLILRSILICPEITILLKKT